MKQARRWWAHAGHTPLLSTDVPCHPNLSKYLSARHPARSQPACPSWGKDYGLPGDRPADPARLTLDVPALLPHLVHQPLCGGEGSQASEVAARTSPAPLNAGLAMPLSRARPTTSRAFINNLLDLGLLGCALSGLFGWRRGCVGSCLGFNPHVCVNFFVGILLLWERKAGDKV